jgi:hypothetical protein
MRLFLHLQLWLTGRGSHLQPATLWSHSLHEDSNAWRDRPLGGGDASVPSSRTVPASAACRRGLLLTQGIERLLRQANTGPRFVGALAP